MRIGESSGADTGSLSPHHGNALPARKKEQAAKVPQNAADFLCRRRAGLLHSSPDPDTNGACNRGSGMTSHRWKLCVMMFLEFFIWGAWFPLASDYLTTLGFSATEKSWALNAFALASLTALFFSNQFADRNFAAEKFLAFSQLVGGVCILALAWVTDFWGFFLLMLIHSLFYVPTISITNSIAFANLKDPQKEFGLVRLWGTIGWIAAAWPFVFILVNWAKVPPL